MKATTAAALWLLAAVPVVAQDDRPARPTLHPDVALLLAPDHRDEALFRLLERGEYRGPGDYTESAQRFEVTHVVPCPQARGLPIFAVFVKGATKSQPNTPTGHLIKVTADGAILRCWLANNVVSEGLCADVNRDGIVERVETMNYGVRDSDMTVRELFVLPMTEEVQPTLRIALGARPRSEFGEPWPLGHRVIPATDEQQARIQIGPVDPETKELKEVVAEWRWHSKKHVWLGPNGAPDKDFMVLPPVGHDGIDEYAATQARKQGR